MRSPATPAGDWDSDYPRRVTVSLQAPKRWQTRVRRVGYVPMQHHNTALDAADIDGVGMIPGYVPDPLWDEQEIVLPVNETHAFWFTLRTPRNAKPGTYKLNVVADHELGPKRCHRVSVIVHDVVLKPRQHFPVTNWFYNDAILDFHDCDTFDERYWDILPRYFDNIVEHGQNTVYAPVFTPPLDGVKRPSQLLIVKRTGKDRYKFDWRDVKRYTDLATKRGVQFFEWTHLFTQWGVKHAIRIYANQGADEKLLWKPETSATSPVYRKFLSQFLPEFHDFLVAENLMDRSFFHVSDEPHGDEHLANYRRARALLKRLAPWMKVMDALTELEFAKQGLTDMPIPSIRSALEFVKEDIPCWCYYCCGPRGRYLNRLMDTPLAKIRMNGWLFYRWPFKGFLHWGYNYWYKSQTRVKIDPFTTQDGLRWPGWAYGDCFMVYPGPDGPVDSIRWEVLGESLQDYALLQTLDIDRNASILRSLKSFQDFPKTEDWVARTRRTLLKRAEKR